MFGARRHFIFELGDREDTCGLLYYEVRSTGANSETKYISNSKEFHHMSVQFSCDKEAITKMSLVGHGYSPNG